MVIDGQKLASDVFKTVDAMDADAFAAFLAEDGVFVYANAEPVRGRMAVREAVAQFFTSIKSLRHAVEAVWTVDDTVIAKLDVTYHRHDGGSVTIPAMTLWRLRDGLIADYQIFNDLTPVYA